MPRPFSVDPPVGRKDPRLHGRDRLITMLASEQSMHSSGRVHVLHGLGGCGKSAIALEVTRRLMADGWRVWWINARSQDQISAGMREVAGRLGASPSQLELAWAGKARSPIDLVWDLLNGAAIGQWLLVFDNADQPHLLAAEDEAGDDRLADENGWLRAPGRDNGAVLVTSRDGNERTWGSWSVLHLVSELEPDDAARVLIDIAGEARGTPEDARALAERLRCHPLTLRNAGLFLKQVNENRIWPGDEVTTFTGFLARLDQQSDDLAHDSDSVAEVRKTWQVCQMSLDQLGERKITKAGPLLRLLAAFGDAPISYAVLLDPARLAHNPLFSPLTAQDLRQTLSGMADFGLLELGRLDDPLAGRAVWTATLHPLVRELSRDHLRRTGEWTGFNALAVQMLGALQSPEPGTLTGLPLDPDNETDWPGWQLLAPQCVDVILDHLDASAPDGQPHEPPRLLLVALDVARLIARYQLAFGLPKQAELFMEACLQRCHRLHLDMDSRVILSLRHERARAAYEQGQLDWAEEELRRIIPLRAAILGEDHLDTLFSRHKLARVLMEQQRWGEAEADLRLIVEGEAQWCGPENHNTLTARHSLARAILAQSRVDEAEAIIDEILAIRERAFGPDEFDTLIVRHTRAQVWLARRQTAAVIAELRRILAAPGTRRQIDHPETISFRRTLTEALFCLAAEASGHAEGGFRAEAIAEMEAILASLRRTYGNDHPETIRAMEELKEAYREVM